ncbi:eotaxin-like isoform X2 [Heterodontus francisci]|uniref:eotaxin-like isoform X2 n=1 Tax=Heterodontus francisci TaxID=7792 RepID=UPI00355C45F9
MFKMHNILNRRSPHLVLFLVMLGFITLITGSYVRPGKVPVNCCKSVSRKMVPFTITRYRIQHVFKPCIKAVIFYTKEKGPVCAHPKARWVLKKIKELRSAAHFVQGNI